VQQYQAETRASDFEYELVDQLTAATYRTTTGTPTILKRYRNGYDSVGNRTSAQADEAPSTWVHDAMNRLTSRVGGGLLHVAGTVSEPAAVTIEGQPARVDGANRFRGTAAVPPGTTTFAVTATDASGNSQRNAYEVDVSAASDTLTYETPTAT
jgi:hypothetical protein